MVSFVTLHHIKTCYAALHLVMSRHIKQKMMLRRFTLCHLLNITPRSFMKSGVMVAKTVNSAPSTQSAFSSA